MRKIVAQATVSIERLSFEKTEVKQAKAWKLHVTAVSFSVQRLRYRGVTHKVLLLTRTIERQHDFERAKAYSIKPGSLVWTTCPGEVRAAFYFNTVNRMLSDTLRGFRGRQLGNCTTDGMLRKATDIMAEVTDIITVDRVKEMELLGLVAKNNRNLRGVKKIMELRRRRDTMAIRKVTLDRQQRLRALCRGASSHAGLVRNTQGRPESPPGGTYTGTSTHDAETRTIRRPGNPTTWERGRAIAPCEQKRRRRRRHRRRHRAKTKTELLLSKAAAFDSMRSMSAANVDNTYPTNGRRAMDGIDGRVDALPSTTQLTASPV
jgi:hypothetical protein